ncbi:apolipoprotein N-acyltransferase [Agromyces rhizosphaerae]|uniref:Apolipoprotein N-acyltransferase n=1 Tax=Agromyces rhizosphaerae TaxID=88374 RepID=A0A9W6D177_9MICO|nr:apolipoprotein N-acyltransferase [Agromyces rhizosphaerae]GLI28927.1 apolipoprotein N-acyltransferase [Agromyces rhizosphaerae]
MTAALHERETPGTVRATRPILPLWAAFAVAVAGGVVYDLGFPDLGIWPLAFLGIGMVLVALIGRGAWSALGVGYAFGAAFWLTHVGWTSLYLGPVPWLALSLFESVFVAVGAVAITLAYRWVPAIGTSRWVRLVLLPLVVAALWIAREFASGTVPYGGFPWARAAASQSESPFAPLVSWIGFTGLSFVMVWVVAAVIELLRLRGWRRPRRALPVAVVVLVAALLPAWPTSAAGSFRVASVQGNGPSGYFDQRERGDVLRAQLDATEPILDESGLDLVLWPEGGSDLDPTRDASAAAIFDDLATRADAPVLLNTVTTTGDEFFNSSLLWVAGEGSVAQFDKRNPVPFGEYIPDRDFYYALAPDLVGLVQRGYSPGTNSPVFDIDGVLAGLAICFDVIYDGLIWEGARDGAQVYLLQTNNADFRGTDENLQQLAFARLRAIETGRPVVNLSTTGTSQVIAADGRTVDALPAYEAGAMVTDVQLRDGLTPAVVLGAWVPWTLTLLGLGGLALGWVRTRRTGRNP